jgi:hypothetical protein
MTTPPTVADVRAHGTAADKHAAERTAAAALDAIDRRVKGLTLDEPRGPGAPKRTPREPEHAPVDQPVISSSASNDPASLTIDELIFMPGVHVVRVGPVEAKRLLERNTSNRALKQRAVADYARDMSEGRWHFSNQGLGLDKHGVLADGQNRLHAVIESGAVITTLLATGLEPEARDVVDTGVKRSFGDVLRMNGRTNVANLAGAVAIRARYELGAQNGWGWTETRSRGRLSHEELLAYLREHPQLEERASGSWLVRKALGKVGLGPIVAFESMAVEVNPDALAYFREAIVSGGMLKARDPRLLLRNHLMKRDRAGDSIWTLGLFVKAWNKWLSGEEVELLTLKETEPLQKIRRLRASDDPELLLATERQLHELGR